MKKSACFLLVLAMLCGAAAAEKRTYDFMMISDTHFGSAASFDAKTLDRKKIIRNIPRSDRLMPQYRALFADMAKNTDADTAFVINGGDLVEGYAKSVKAQNKEITAALALLREYFKVPVYSIKGNREIAWKYGPQAYLETMLPEISRTAGKPLKEANYSVAYGPDLFIFVDFWSKEWRTFITGTLKGLAAKPRYLFIVVHAGILPSCRKGDLKLCDTLAAGYNTIILHGHTHQTRLVEYGGKKGSLIQFSISTFIPPEKTAFVLPPVDERQKALAFFRGHRAKNDPVKEGIYDKYCVPKIKRYLVYGSNHDRYQAAGYARIQVSDAGVVATVQGADLKQPPFEVILRSGK